MGVTRGCRVIRIACTALVMVVSLALPVANADAAKVITAHPILPPHNPKENFRLASVSQVLASIDAARKDMEGLGPLVFDAARFARLSVPEQIFVVSNLERTTRGLYPAMAMVRRLDSIAALAAQHDQDPTDRGKGFSSIWSSAPSALGQYAFFADFGWMYDDGPPPQYIFRNVDCARPGDSGCWGHRDNILSRPLQGWTGCRSELVTGTGFVARTPDGPSLSQIFEVACTNVGGLAFTWSQAVEYLKIPRSESGPIK